jgi:hypothetical protein
MAAPQRAGPELPEFNQETHAEESLIVDVRGELTPAQMVERKLMTLLRGRGLLASHIQMSGLLKDRG